MFITIPESPNGLVFVSDVRLRRDRNLAEKEGGTPVLDSWPFGVACLGRLQWARTTRIALYDYGEKITSKIKHERQSELVEWLRTHKPKVTIVMQTRSSEQKSQEDFGDASGLKGTHCWAAMKGPDRIPDMAGCVWAAPWGHTIPVLNPVNYEYVFRELIRRHIRLGQEMLTRDVTLKPRHMVWERSPSAVELLADMYASGRPLAIDIESDSEKDLITAIGFSDGIDAVSLPFEAFDVFGQNRVEPGATSQELGLIQKILGSSIPKVFHNYSYDVPFLESKGFAVAGPIHDTMAMHVCVYKQWPHGLQRACAQELPVPPWKSEHRPQYAKRLGLTKKDVGWWTCEPEELRRYNALDSYYTAKLAQALAWKVGLKWVK